MASTIGLIITSISPPPTAHNNVAITRPIDGGIIFGKMPSPISPSAEIRWQATDNFLYPNMSISFIDIRSNTN